MTFAERLKELRKEKKLSMEEVAQAIGVGRANIYKYEHGIITNIPPDKVHKLANLFGVSRPYLMGWTDERRANPSDNLDTVAEKLSEQMQNEPSETMWSNRILSTEDCTTAASQALRAIVRFGISRTPVYPHKILQQSSIATMVSYETPKELDEIERSTNLVVRSYMDRAVMRSFYVNVDGKKHYIFAVNRYAPIGKTKNMLAFEIGHIYLGHTKPLLDIKKQTNEAFCFAVHFEFPRPMIRLLQERGFVFTKRSFSRIFGDCDWLLSSLDKAQPVETSPELNRLVKEQFTEHVDLLQETGILSMPTYGEEVLDLSKYMAGYME